MNKQNHEFIDKILTLLHDRGPNKTICPSEVLPPELKKDKQVMELVRDSAKFLALQNIIDITQGGEPVDPLDFKGPIRLRLK